MIKENKGMRIPIKTCSLAILIFLSSCIAPNNNVPSVQAERESALDDQKNEYDQQSYQKNLTEEDQWVKQQMLILTKNYRQVPSYDQISQFMDQALSGPVDTCPKDPASMSQLDSNDQSSVHPAAIGARKLLASYYQSCSALDKAIDQNTPRLRGVETVRSYGAQKGVAGGKLRRLYNTQSYVESHSILKDLKNDPQYPGPQCRDVTQQPPLYGYGSTAVARGGELKIFQAGAGVVRSSEPSAAIDCSDFISVALASQGLKTGFKTPPYERLTTTGFAQRMKAKNSCLAPSVVSPDDPIRPGDMINLSGSHIVMVDSVGSDPMGIDKHLRSNSCDKITPKDFNFTYIHSGAIKNSYGPSRVKASMHRSGVMWTSMALVARKLCVQKSRDQNGYLDSKALGLSSRMSLIRHKTHVPECVGEKSMKIEGEQCISGCKNLAKDI